MKALMLASVVTFATSRGGAQGAGAAWPTSSPSWEDQQKSQAWATAKLAISPRHHEWVSIKHGDRTLRAFVTYPTGTAKVPVVLVTHEVFGLTDSSRNTADEIAAMGYITIAPDMVSGLAPNGGGTSAFPDSRMTSDVMTSLPNEIVNAVFGAWANYGLRLPRANSKLAMVGLSWGGGASFRYAATPGHNPALKAVCVFFDVGPPTVTQGPNRMAKDNPPLAVDAIDVPVYGFYGSKDTRVMMSLQATKEAMAAAGKTYEPVVYVDADHAFMRVGEDPGGGNPANLTAVDASLVRLKAVLAKM